MLSSPEFEILTNKFPQYTCKIIQLYENDSNFRALCDDYCLGISILLKSKPDQSDLALEIEYTTICGLLEQELIEYLDPKSDL